MRRLMQLCCILLLLFAQQTALTHALWHAERQLPAAAGTSSTAHVTHESGGADIALLCAFDVAVGQVLGGVASSSYTPPQPTATSGAPHRLARSSPPSYFPAALSRGPPSLLAS
jgi:hypothetical protein